MSDVRSPQRVARLIEKIRTPKLGRAYEQRRELIMWMRDYGPLTVEEAGQIVGTKGETNIRAVLNNLYEEGVVERASVLRGDGTRYRVNRYYLTGQDGPRG